MGWAGPQGSTPSLDSVSSSPNILLSVLFLRSHGLSPSGKTEPIPGGARQSCD